jgi:hypothetical protein
VSESRCREHPTRPTVAPSDGAKAGCIALLLQWRADKNVEKPRAADPRGHELTLGVSFPGELGATSPRNLCQTGRRLEAPGPPLLLRSPYSGTPRHSRRSRAPRCRPGQTAERRRSRQWASALFAVVSTTKVFLSGQLRGQLSGSSAKVLFLMLQRDAPFELRWPRCRRSRRHTGPASRRIRYEHPPTTTRGRLATGPSISCPPSWGGAAPPHLPRRGAATLQPGQATLKDDLGSRHRFTRPCRGR